MQFLDLNIPKTYIPGIPVPPNIVSGWGCIQIKVTRCWCSVMLLFTNNITQNDVKWYSFRTIKNCRKF